MIWVAHFKGIFLSLFWEFLMLLPESVSAYFWSQYWLSIQGDHLNKHMILFSVIRLHFSYLVKVQVLKFIQTLVFPFKSHNMYYITIFKIRCRFHRHFPGKIMMPCVSWIFSWKLVEMKAYILGFQKIYTLPRVLMRRTFRKKCSKYKNVVKTSIFAW